MGKKIAQPRRLANVGISEIEFGSNEELASALRQVAHYLEQDDNFVSVLAININHYCGDENPTLEVIYDCFE